MFLSNSSDEFRIKITGFEYATSFSNTTISANNSELEYTPPEVLNKQVGDYKVDIWAVGILTYFIIEGCTPFYD